METLERNDRIYADTREEAIRLVGDELDLPDDVAETAEACPDPEIDNCWLVVLASGERYLAYTSGHRMPRLRNEVESLGRIERKED